MKEKIKEIIPKPLLEQLREIRGHIRVKREYYKDARKYVKNSNLRYVGNSAKGVQELLIFHSHALEKGLSHPEFRYNFGKSALLGLRDNLNEFSKLGLNPSLFAYQNAISVLKAYKEKHESRGISTPLFDRLFSKSEIDRGTAISGVEEHSNRLTENMNFSEIETYRVSQREFLSDKVNPELLVEATNLALKTPSVCNRQPWQVYMISNGDKISQLLHLQKGFEGYDIPPVLCMVTVDQRAFVGSYERNEAYIDGGLFLMNFDFALTYVGLASCILNAMQPNEEQRKIRAILGIPSSEVLIAFIAIGYAKSKVTVAKSARKPVKDILKVID
ncbi:nitroreductase family protein [Levilactobacillus sp. HBUAS70063]|uniref:nitroreductase family protein n=1 Tax=Levilactobacillus sp. HBUAS70063 TaxID=3109359 RepID=UPI0031334CB1